MKKNSIVIILIFFTASVILSSCSTASIATPTLNATVAIEGATLVQERCTVCHSLDRIMGAHYTAVEWKSVVDTMIAAGAQLTPQEETIVVDYLAAYYGP